MEWKREKVGRGYGREIRIRGKNITEQSRAEQNGTK
jgi:hypothetical protein